MGGHQRGKLVGERIRRVKGVKFTAMERDQTVGGRQTMQRTDHVL